MSDQPTFRDLYEVQQKIDTRMSRMERGFILLTVLVASPKLGGPDPSQIIGTILHQVL